MLQLSKRVSIANYSVFLVFKHKTCICTPSTH